MKKPKQSQPEGGVDIFKKKPIPKKPSQPEGSGAPKKLIQRQPEGSGAPKKKKLIQRQPEGSGAPKKITGRVEFRDTDKSKKIKTTTKTTTKTKVKPKVVTPKMIKDAGFTTLRDYLNDKRGLTRRDGKKVVKTTKTKSSAPKAPPPAPNRGKKKIVSSLKVSRSGIDGAATTVKKKNKDKTGLGSKVMSTKTPKTFRGTNITPTKLQRDRMRKRTMGST